MGRLQPVPLERRVGRLEDERVKRLRAPKLKDGELRVYWGRLPGDSPDVVFAWQGDASMKRDSALLHYHLGSQRPDPKVSPLYSKMLPSLLEDLEARGYDLTTLHFSIVKKAANAKVTGAVPTGDSKSDER